MVERTTETPYSAKILTEAIEYATGNITPKSNYHIDLDGVSKKRYMMKAIAVKNGVTPDEKSGVSLSLSHNSLTNRLELDKLSMQLEGQPGSKLEIIRNEFLGKYMSVIAIGQSRHEGMLINDPNFGMSTLDEYEIDSPNTDDPTQYSLWRARLLDSTRGWRIAESLVVNSVVNIDTSSEIKISRQEIVNNDQLQNTKISAVEKSITLYPNEDIDTIHTSHETVELTQRNEKKTLSLFQHTSSLKPDLFIINNDEYIESPRQRIELDVDSYYRFKNLIDDAIVYKRNLNN